MMLNRSTIVLPSLLLLSFVGCAPQGEEVAPEVTVSESSPEEETTNFRLPSFILQADEFKNLNQWDAGEKCCNHSIMLSSTIYRKGKTSVRFEQRPDDRSNIGGDGNFRAEIKQPAPLARKGKTYWVGFSVYPVKIPMLTNFFQFHQKPDKDKPWGSPPFQLRLYPDKRVELIIHPGQGAKIIQLGTYKPKQWNDIAMQV
ncbi:MAG: heparin lyase I family protein [Thermonemataceae bacterium]